MSTLPHITANPVSETPSVSETAVGGQAAGSLEPKASNSEPAIVENAAQPAQNKTMSAEEAAEKLYAERMEDEYAKREGGA
ncbi:hypothetical protein AMS68_007996 [Peltaster fructicola]|uniref:Uncharacterized protein n=1 Tax=Peltaster fructicola TaxID=286661 RepID=A0A6H0Y6M7_9PEZI|nr:hypothetical protein AMS68_007996 [Peltaster fructicola]